MAKLKFALIGCGGYMGQHAQRLKNHPDVQIAALCDVSDAVLERFTARNLAEYQPAPKRYIDMTAMYAQEKFDGVFIATPHTLHYEHAAAALDAGCHVYVEKPMVTDLRQARDLEKKVRQAGKTLVIGYNSTCSPEFTHLKQLIAQESLGKLEMINGFIAQSWMKHTVGLWRQDPKLSGGGMAYDSGAHLLNSLCWSVGQDVEQVFALVDNHGTPVDINAAFVLRFVNGVTASISVAGNCPSNAGVLTYMFENGRVEIDGWTGNWIRVWRGNEQVKYPPISAEMGSPSPTHNFVDVLMGRAKPRTSPREGIIQSQLMDAIYESARTGKVARPGVSAER